MVNSMNVWHYIVSSAGSSIGSVAMEVILASTFLTLVGVALIVLPKELAHWSLARTLFYGTASLQQIGLEERKLRAEFRVKIGISLIIWNSALILSILLRLLGTPGLETRLLPAIVLFLAPLLVIYVFSYRYLLFPRYLTAARQLDTRKSYEVSKKKKKSSLQKSGQEKVSAMPTKALIGLFTAPLLYYIVMIAVSIPPGTSPQSHDHLLHQFGMPVIGLLGYLIGLFASLGDDLRPLLPWIKMQSK